MLKNPNSIINVTRSDGLFDKSEPVLPQEIYQAALKELNKLKQEKYTKQLDECFLLYQIKGENSCQTGLL